MDKEMIKQQYTMKDILVRYGIMTNHSGFIRCPFHSGDHTASMKIYKNNYYCFGCGATGDIFTFIQDMENCDFRSAFEILGGTYEKPTFSSRMAIYHHQKHMEMRHKKEKGEKEKLQECLAEIDFCRMVLDRVKPLSDAWCKTYNKLQWEMYKHGILTGLEEGD
jgi:DNA primase